MVNSLRHALPRRSKGKASRTLGLSLWGRPKDPINFRNYPPGQHGVRSRKKTSDYSKQFAERMKFKTFYRITARQLYNIYMAAYNKRGETGMNMTSILESRLSSVLFRSGLTSTIFSSRQAISHRHILVNGKRVNFSSLLLKPGDIVSFTERGQNLQDVNNAVAAHPGKVPPYLEVDVKNKSVKFIRFPDKKPELSYPGEMDIELVVEFYS